MDTIYESYRECLTESSEPKLKDFLKAFNKGKTNFIKQVKKVDPYEWYDVAQGIIFDNLPSTFQIEDDIVAYLSDSDFSKLQNYIVDLMNKNGIEVE